MLSLGFPRDLKVPPEPSIIVKLNDSIWQVASVSNMTEKDVTCRHQKTCNVHPIREHWQPQFGILICLLQNKVDICIPHF